MAWTTKRYLTNSTRKLLIKLHGIRPWCTTTKTWREFPMIRSTFPISFINHQGRLQDFCLGGSIRNINYIKSKTKETWIYQYHKKKKKNLQLPSTRFHILKPLHDKFIINPTSYIFFNVHSQTIIQPLIPHLIVQFILDIFHSWKTSFHCCSWNRKGQN